MAVPPIALPPTLVSVDLDDVGCYHAIHGLTAPESVHAGVGWSHWLPRFLDLFANTGVRATFFVIGRDLARDQERGGPGAAALRRAIAEGHELGNHSFSHAYDLVRWSAERQRRDLAACDALLRELGADVMGFRAPGYSHDAGLLSAAAALGYRYDSSSLPSPLYYAAKLMVMGAMALRGERSSSLADHARSFLGTRHPHRREDVPLLELPMSVSPVVRVPLIGTSLLASPRPVSRWLRRSARSLPHLHLELHGIDLACPDGDPIADALCHRQPELRVPLAKRAGRLEQLLRARGGGSPLRDAIDAVS
ncbi:MAG: polysaccharide deacetylase family protein [Deltaproteobacteria bacterium]|nr:polysaccharide deacetylase family protein [Deltaproteobacteria bacterium]